MTKKNDEFEAPFDAPSEESGDFFAPDFSDTHDEIALPDGSEARLQISAVNDGAGTKGRYKRITYTIPDEPYAKTISYFLMLPDNNCDARTRNRRNLQLRDFIRAHGLSETGFNWGDLVGCEATAILGLETSEEYGDQNRVKKFL